ncbi:unnamed protein product, partial [Closterium sp. NIES-54]
VGRPLLHHDPHHHDRQSRLDHLHAHLHAPLHARLCRCAVVLPRQWRRSGEGFLPR